MVRVSFVRLFVLMAGGLLTLGGAAAQTAAFTPAKVGIINVQEAILRTAAIQKAQAALEAKYKPRQAELEKIQGELQQIQAQLEKQGSQMTPQAAQEMQARGKRRQVEAQRLTEDLQADVDRERNDILGKNSQRMQEVVRKMAEERGLDVVIDQSNTIYFKGALDLTKEATAAFDKAFPAT